MNIPPEKMAEYLRGARERAKRPPPTSDEYYASAWEAARRAAALIHERFPAARVRVFGSLVFRTCFFPHSDIDLAIEGVPVGEYLNLWDELQSREPNFKIDLVEADRVPAALRASIDEEGQDL